MEQNVLTWYHICCFISSSGLDRHNTEGFLCLRSCLERITQDFTAALYKEGDAQMETRAWFESEVLQPTSHKQPVFYVQRQINSSTFDRINQLWKLYQYRFFSVVLVPAWITGHSGPDVGSQLEDWAACLAELLTKLPGFSPENPTYQTPAGSLESCLIPTANLLPEHYT